MARTYLIIKPDGMKFKKEVMTMLKSKYEIIAVYELHNFCNIAVELYLDEEAIQRGNLPIIFGINHIWRNIYKIEKAILLILESRAECSQYNFIMEVCHFKKKYRSEHIENGYVEYEISPQEIDYTYDKTCFVHDFDYKRLDNSTNTYFLQVNALHCPDTVESYEREIKILKKYIVNQQHENYNRS